MTEDSFVWTYNKNHSYNPAKQSNASNDYKFKLSLTPSLKGIFRIKKNVVENV